MGSGVLDATAVYEERACDKAPSVSVTDRALLVNLPPGPATLTECVSCQALMAGVFKDGKQVRPEACEGAGAMGTLCRSFLRDYAPLLTKYAGNECATERPSNMCFWAEACDHRAHPRHLLHEVAPDFGVVAPPPRIRPRPAPRPGEGPAGPDGKKGFKGDKGPKGYKGRQGPQGLTGPDGPRGDKGPAGPSGKRACPLGPNGEMCSAHGRCDDGVCRCGAAHSGAACQHQKQPRTCTAVGDPHWRSFDGRTFDEYGSGEYLQFEARGDATHSAVVTRQCSGHGVAWNCGVAVRRGNDIISAVMNVPGQSWGQMHGSRRDMTITMNCGGNILPAVRDAGTRGISADSGLRLKWFHDGALEWSVPDGSLRVWMDGPDVTITYLAAPEGQAKGLCGNNNNNPNDDITGAFRDRNQPAMDWLNRWAIAAARSPFRCQSPAGAPLTLTSLASDISLSSSHGAYILDGGNENDKTNKAVDATTEQIKEAQRVCAFLFGKGLYDACVKDVAQTGAKEWAFVDARGVKMIANAQRIAEATLHDMVRQEKKQGL